ncbi:hypothetical protein BJ742DRAFT_799595 [Cladochytrium replicatum]|nr:hypothetical protein BJ742DRAFT_799595 [Cladochytrium replicatum]
MDDKLIAQFVAVTSATPNDARKFLENEDWDLQEALTAFYDAGATPLQPPAQSFSSASSQPVSSASSARPSGSGARQTGSRGSPRNVRTFSEIAGADSNSDDEGEDYFAGGEKSGILMKGGAGKKPEPSDLVKQILEKASKAGPPEEDFEKKEKKKPAFVGSGYRLGSEDEPPLQTPQASSSSARAPATPAGQDMEVVERQLTFWRNGFSIDDGPLMSHDDPQARQFLEAINSGRAPPQLLNVAYGQPVEIKVAHRMEEDYKPAPKKPMKAFSGGGQRLGAPIPGETVGVPTTSIPGSFPGSAAPAGGAAAAAASESLGPALVVDESAPVTSIQVRLADGSRAVYKFNHTHTVGDIRNHINRNRPGDASRAYGLMTTFPNRELTDSSATIKDAGLVNAVIVQKYS